MAQAGNATVLSSAHVLKSTLMENDCFSAAGDCEECKTSVRDAQNELEGNWIWIYVSSCKSNYLMQINANYAAGAESDRNWEGERECKDLRLENSWELFNRAQSWWPSLCVAQPGSAAGALTQQLLLQRTSCLQVKGEKQTMLGTLVLPLTLMWQVTLGMCERQWAHKANTWVWSTGTHTWKYDCTSIFSSW